MLNDIIPRIPVRSLPAAAGGTLSSIPTPPRLRPALPARPLRAVGGAVRRKPVSRGCLSSPSAPSTRRVLMRTFVSTIDDEKFETVGFPGPTAGAGGGYVISPWAAPIGAAYRFPSRCAAGAAPRCSAGPSQCGIPSCLLAPVLPVLLRQAEDGLAVVVGRLLGSIFAIFG